MAVRFAFDYAGGENLIARIPELDIFGRPSSRQWTSRMTKMFNAVVHRPFLLLRHLRYTLPGSGFGEFHRCSLFNFSLYHS